MAKRSLYCIICGSSKLNHKDGTSLVIKNIKSVTIPKRSSNTKGIRYNPKYPSSLRKLLSLKDSTWENIVSNPFNVQFCIVCIESMWNLSFYIKSIKSMYNKLISTKKSIEDKLRRNLRSNECEDTSTSASTSTSSSLLKTEKELYKNIVKQIFEDFKDRNVSFDDIMGFDEMHSDELNEKPEEILGINDELSEECILPHKTQSADEGDGSPCTDDGENDNEYDWGFQFTEVDVTTVNNESYMKTRATSSGKRKCYSELGTKNDSYAPSKKRTKKDCDSTVLKQIKKEKNVDEPEENSSVSYSCLECDAEFISGFEFKKHRREEHPSLNCPFCPDKVHSTRQQKYDHLLNVHPFGRMYDCVYCTKMYKKEEDLKSHVFLHEKLASGGQDTKVPEKVKTSESSTEVDSEEKTESSRFAMRIPFKCVLCEVDSFSNMTELVFHVRLEHEPLLAATRCSQCPKAFKTESSLRSHVKTVHRNTITEYKCEGCKFTTCFESIYEKHLNLHAKWEYLCDQCEKGFMSRTSLKEHNIREHSTESALACSTCGKRFVRSKDLRRHEQGHIDQEAKAKNKMMTKSKITKINQKVKDEGIDVEFNEPKQCPNCPETFPLLINLVMHRRSEHGEVISVQGEFLGMKRSDNSYSCRYCGKVCKNLHLLQTHIYNVHTFGDMKNCNYCQKLFAETDELEAHEILHCEQKNPFTCVICNTEHLATKALVIHVREEHEPLWDMNRCDICRKVFRNKTELNKHVKLRHKERPKELHCPHCSFVADSPYSLKAHLLTHSNDEDKYRYVCELCGKRSTTAGNHNLHLREVHLKEKRYSCRICNRKFFSGPSLMRHEEGHNTKTSYVCEQCGKSYNTSMGLKHHLQRAHIKPYFCKVCDDTYGTLRALKRHVKRKKCQVLNLEDRSSYITKNPSKILPKKDEPESERVEFSIPSRNISEIDPTQLDEETQRAISSIEQRAIIEINHSEAINQSIVLIVPEVDEEVEIH